jgi:outer membrane murein-binding lipoprotein Lpp
VSLVGILAALLVSTRPWSRNTEARASTVVDSGVTALTSRVEAMERQVSDLAQRIEQLEADRLAVREPVLPQPSADTAQSDHSLDELAQRVSRLERQHVVVRSGVFISAPEQTTQDPVDADQRTWVDLAQQDVYPWTDDIIAEMTSIGLSSKDDRAREEVWIGAESEFRSDLLVQPLISALADPIADVREEAADALSQYLDYPGVSNALGWTSNYDESGVVRDEAARALRGEE